MRLVRSKQGNTITQTVETVEKCKNRQNTAIHDPSSNEKPVFVVILNYVFRQYH
jgi:hypothetical protein